MAGRPHPSAAWEAIAILETATGHGGRPPRQARPMQMLIEVVDGGSCGVIAIEDCKPQSALGQNRMPDKSFGRVLPGHGPAHMLSDERPPFGRWEAD